ncbi:DUF7916 family protein [Candidatus Stoquefichus sp. SB1]|uniref:DUF7916 family protein n=1 Tax=Candidatus Stoquefichus sp. SB1 TaxID=1658109 RepID=UPI00067E90B4|nr:hypothetical protein [Candidatus Stoquefichus sp. SB1]
MKLDYRITRLITAKASEVAQYTPMQLKEAILKSEGRVIMGQTYLNNPILIPDCTSTELMFAFGGDMVMLNGFHFENPQEAAGMQGLTLKELRAKVAQKPVGIYMGCPKANDDLDLDPKKAEMKSMLYSKENALKAKELGASFIVLGGNPGSGTSIYDVIRATKEARETLGEDMLIFAGKWEDGIVEKVLGDPLADYDAKAVIKELIDAGADVIDLPAPGSRHGITVEMIRELTEYTHRYKPGTLVMCFLDSNVEIADQDTIRQIAILMKQTGADIHAIGDGGFGGGTWPENIYQLAITMKGKAYTWAKMATPLR